MDVELKIPEIISVLQFIVVEPAKRKEKNVLFPITAHIYRNLIFGVLYLTSHEVEKCKVSQNIDVLNLHRKWFYFGRSSIQVTLISF